MKFRVAQKGFLLAGVPLVFEFVLFLGLLTLLHQSEVTADHAMESRAIVSRLEPALTDYLTLIDAADVDRLFSISGEQEYNDDCIFASVAGRRNEAVEQSAFLKDIRLTVGFPERANQLAPGPETHFLPHPFPSLCAQSAY